MAKCSTDVTKHCGQNRDERKKSRNPGETVHCLLKAASEHRLTEEDCEAELKLLVREADVGSDWKIDPILQKSCQDVVIKACNANAGPSGVMSCLMTSAATNSRHMTKECASVLMELQYFLARDYSLDPKLYK